MTPAGKLRQIVANAKGDDLERTTREFKGLDPSARWIGERTIAEIHMSYLRERAEWQAASDLLEELLRKANL